MNCVGVFIARNRIAYAFWMFEHVMKLRKLFLYFEAELKWKWHHLVANQ